MLGYAMTSTYLVMLAIVMCTACSGRRCSLRQRLT